MKKMAAAMVMAVLLPVCFLFPLSQHSNVMAATDPPTISVTVIERFVDKLVFRTRSQAASPIITKTTFHFSLDGTTWLEYPIDAPTPTQQMDFNYGFVLTFTGTALSQQIQYRGSVTYLVDGHSETATTPNMTASFNPLPIVSVSKESFSDGIRFTVTVQTKGNVVVDPMFHYSYSGLHNDIPLNDSNQVADNAFEISVPISDVPISYHTSATYQDSTGKSWDVVTGTSTARASPLPEISVNLKSVDTESITVTVNLSSQGNNIFDWWVAYSTPSVSSGKATGEPSGPQEYTVILQDLGAGTPVSFWGVVTFECLFGQGSLETVHKSASTSQLPQIDTRITDVGFTSISFEHTVLPNSNPLTASRFEYRLAGTSAWQQQAGALSGDYQTELTGLPSGAVIQYRAAVTWQTTGGERSLVTQAVSKPLYRCVTKKDYFHWQYFPEGQTGNLRVFADVTAYKATPSDISHLDKGFVWSENKTPVLEAGNRQVSLGSTDTPESGTEILALLQSLTVGKTYYYRPYVIDASGQIIYGEAAKFVTFMTDVGLFIPIISPGAVIYPTQATSVAISPGPSGETTIPETEPAPSSGSMPTPPVATTATEKGTNPATGETSAIPTSEPSEAIPDDRLQPDRSGVWLPVLIAVLVAAAAGGGALFYRKRRMNKQA